MSYHHTQVQAQIAAVLIALDRSSEEVCPAVRESINNLASTADVFAFGRVGDVIAFEPLAHYVINPVEGSPPEFVAVELSGVRALRDDGSVRTLSRALVRGV